MAEARGGLGFIAVMAALLVALLGLAAYGYGSGRWQSLPCVNPARPSTTYYP